MYDTHQERIAGYEQETLREVLYRISGVETAKVVISKYGAERTGECRQSSKVEKTW